MFNRPMGPLTPAGPGRPGGPEGPGGPGSPTSPKLIVPVTDSVIILNQAYTRLYYTVHSVL